MLKNFLLDLIFPRFCLGCQKELNLKQVSFICEACLNNIVLNGIQCHVCGLRNNVGVPKGHRKCRKNTFLNGLFAAGQYQDPVLREAIAQFKYQSAESLKKPLAELLIKYLKKENLIEKLRCPTPNAFGVGHRSCLVPIPLTWRRKLSRGFNQSELLAVEISKYLNLPVANLLKRKKFGAPQAKISDWKQRKENISGAFKLTTNNKQLTTHNLHWHNKVILIDDVSTSGSTLEEAARILKEAGIKEVYAMVIAKG